MWVNIEYVSCVIPKSLCALWELHKYLDVPRYILDIFIYKVAYFFASQDALEVIMSVSHSVTLRTKLTDVTLVSEDTY